MTSRRLWLSLYYGAAAGLALFGFGSGAIIGDGQAELHIDPTKFVADLMYAWDPSQFLGRHTGFSHVYEMPYSWLYAVLHIAHLGPDLAQRIVMFLLYLSIVLSMHFCLRAFDEELPLIAVVAGATCYLLNVYVAFNSQGSIPMLLTYAALPALAGVVVLVASTRWRMLNGALVIALVVICEGGVNPPLLAINLVLLTVLAAVLILASQQRVVMLWRLLRFLVVAGVASISISAYWLVPFLDYMRTAWVAGILIEPASMHNASTSFVNVFRGLGQWAIFAGDGGRPYYPWAPAYQTWFSLFLWIVPIAGTAALLRRRSSWQSLFFLACVVVSLPLVVGYYHDALGASITTPLYDWLYRDVPGFQMFRSAYKWVSGYELGVSGLFAYATAAACQVGERPCFQRRPISRFVAVVFPACLVAIPVIAYLPVAIGKANYPMLPLPSWQRHETALVGTDQTHRVAVFPTQYLESFLWGEPTYSVENSLIERPAVIGYLGDAPSPGSDRWIKAFYRLTRIGAPTARSIMEVLNIDTILERDDAIPRIDFSFPDEPVANNTALTRDMVSRILRAKVITSDGPLTKYRVGKALPLIYGVQYPRLSADPAFDIADIGDPEQLAKGVATVSPVDWKTDLSSISGISIVPASADDVNDIAVELSKTAGSTLRPLRDSLTIVKRGKFRLFVHFAPKYAGDYHHRAKVRIDRRVLTSSSDGAYKDFGTISLANRVHHMTVSECLGSCEVDIVPIARFERSVQRTLRMTSDARGRETYHGHVYAGSASIDLQGGSYRIVATPMYPVKALDRVTAIELKKLHRTPVAFDRNEPSSDGYWALPFVPLGNIRTTYYDRYPDQWFDRSASFYNIVGNGRAPWFLMQQRGSFDVFSPVDQNSIVHGTLHMSLQVPTRAARVSSVSFNGQLHDTEPIHTTRGHDYPDSTDSAFPERGDFKIRLAPGWNEVTLQFPRAHERGIGSAPFFDVGIAPDLRFSAMASAIHEGIGVRGMSAIATYPLPLPMLPSAGDPHLRGVLAGNPALDTWIAVSSRCGAETLFRVYELTGGAFDVDLLGGLPSRATPCGVMRAWIAVVAPDGHILPTEAAHLFRDLVVTQSGLAPSPGALLVDGRPVEGPMTLARGIHHFRFAGGAGIRNVTVTRSGTPPARIEVLPWRRSSPVHLVIAPGVRANSLLVFGESFHPEWRASCGGKDLLHVIVDGYANGWIVPAACSSRPITLGFIAQRLYTISAIISIMTLLVLGSLPFLIGKFEKAGYAAQR